MKEEIQLAQLQLEELKKEIVKTAHDTALEKFYVFNKSFKDICQKVNKLKGKDISIAGKILAVADTFDAMTSDRPYRKGVPHQQALNEIKDHINSQFDPKVANAFLKAYEDELIEVKR